MAWPFTRLRTYIPLVTPVAAADLNAIQDAIINGVAGNKHPDRTLIIPGDAAITPASATVAPATGSIASTAGVTWHYAVPLEPGCRIKSVKMVASGNGVADFGNFTIFKVTDPIGGGAFGVTNLVAPIIPAANTPAVFTAYTMDVAPDYVVLADEKIRISIVCGAAALVIGHFEVTYDRNMV